ncbi:MAG TPA: NAD+ synthase [Nitrospira sp.]|nr:NAD+ synthase [Nitrospira sp.]
MRTFRIAMVQMNPTVGDLDGNARRILRWLRESRKAKPDLVAFPELAVTGYPPEDLLLKPKFVDDNRRALNEIVRAAKDVVAVVGYVGQGDSAGHHPPSSPVAAAGRHEIYNAAALLAGGRLLTTYAKRHLPNYGVFDERRYFTPGRRLPLVTINGTAVAVNICEDIWLPNGPTRRQAAAGAEIIVNINASPFHLGKSRAREQMLATRARDNGVIVTYTNMVGGQDELVFDGHSVVLDHMGDLVARAKGFEEDLLVVDLNVEAVARNRAAGGRARRAEPSAATPVERVALRTRLRKKQPRVIAPVEPLGDPLDEVYEALTVGVRDYVKKNGFKHVLVGLSGGIDSALTAAIAVDALGADNVLGVFMPSPYTSRESREDTIELVRRLAVRMKTLSITPTFKTYLRTLHGVFAATKADQTEENLQARIRGNLLMALSNKFGHLVLTTGNKSEMSVGYATLYGDMAGGFAVIKDVPKTMVYELAHRRNRRGEQPVIPKRIIDRAPTAELRANQKDEDNLPPYAVLDPILKAYVEDDRSVEEMVDMGFDRKTVLRIVALVDRSEYKRRQAPVGIKITHRGLGKDRRMPVTNGYQGM